MSTSVLQMSMLNVFTDIGGSRGTKASKEGENSEREIEKEKERQSGD